MFCVLKTVHKPIKMYHKSLPHVPSSIYLLFMLSPVPDNEYNSRYFQHNVFSLDNEELYIKPPTFPSLYLLDKYGQVLSIHPPPAAANSNYTFYLNSTKLFNSGGTFLIENSGKFTKISSLTPHFNEFTPYHVVMI